MQITKLFTKNKERIQKLNVTGDTNTFIKRNWPKVAFSVIWLMQILKIYIEESLLVKYCVIEYL